MMEVTNDDRADWAAETCDRFQEITRTDDDSVLCDLLCDLMHLADRQGIDFDGELARGRLLPRVLEVRPADAAHVRRHRWPTVAGRRRSTSNNALGGIAITSPCGRLPTNG